MTTMESKLAKMGCLIILIASLLVGCEKDEPVYITINKLSSTVELGQTLQLSAEISGAGKNKVSSEVMWSSNMTEHVAIDQDGLVSGLKLTDVSEGATIKATLPNGLYATAMVRVVPPNPQPNKIFLNTAEYYLRPGGADTTITAIVLPASLTDIYDAEWTVDNAEVIEIKSVKKESGKTKAIISPRANGEARLTVTMGDKKASCKIFVGALVDLSWSSKESTIYMQKTLFPNTEMELEAFAKVQPDDDATLAGIKYDWTMDGAGALLKNISSDDQNKRIQRATVVAGELPSKVKVFIAAKDKKIEAEIVIRNRYELESVELELDLAEIFVNQNLIPTLRIFPTKAQDDWMDLIEWSSSNPNVASVDNKGNIRGLSPGNTIIVARVNNKEASLEIVVKPIVENILINSGEVVLMQGDRTTWTATVLPEASQDAFPVSWSSDALDVATINSQTGEITAIAPGQALITVSAGDKSATRTISVVAAETSISINDQNVKDALYYFDGSVLDIYIDTKENKNYTLQIPLSAITNGNHVYTNGSCVWRHLKEYTVSGMGGSLSIEDGLNGKRLIGSGQIEKLNGDIVTIDFDVDAYEF